MGADSSHGPRPWVQHQARTLFLRVPSTDWVEVKRGLKTEFRASPAASSFMESVETPTPVVGYRQHPTLGPESKLMILEEWWKEPLGAIGAGSLRREGFETLAEFRTYWCARERRRFQPMKMVAAARVRPFLVADEIAMGKMLFERLYGEFD